MSDPSPGNWRRASVRINLSALSHNLQKVREYAPGSKVMPVIKANAYGHGMLDAARQLADADMFAVAMPEEAAVLRGSGCDKAILVLHGFSDIAELKAFSRLNISTVIHQQSQLECLLEHRLASPVDCWIKVDTGMHRLGIKPAQVESFFARLRDCANVSGIYMMSHFANADTPEDTLNNNQIDNFIKVTNNIDAGRSMANSAAIMRLPESHFEVVRPGIMLYGSSPFHDISAQQLGLQAVMQFETILLDIKQVRAGESIGYGATYVCARDMTVGIVAAGYGDGYPRHAKSGTPVWVAGSCCDLLGRVSMDSVCIDLTGVEARVGDRVVLWGEELSVDTVAAWCGTISYELLCHAGAACLKS